MTPLALRGSGIETHSLAQLHNCDRLIALRITFCDSDNDQSDQTPKESTDFSPFCFPPFFSSVSFPGLLTATGGADGERDHGPGGCGRGIHRV